MDLVYLLCEKNIVEKLNLKYYKNEMSVNSFLTYNIYKITNKTNSTLHSAS